MGKLDYDDRLTWGDWAILAAMVGFLFLGGWGIGATLHWVTG